MIKISKGKTPKASNQNKPSPTVAGALAPVSNLQTLAKAFAPVVEMRAAKDLKVNRRNARSHSERQVQQIASSVNEFGWLAPIVVDEEGIVLAGHGRLRAAQLLHMETVPTIQVKHLTPERKRAFMLADNRLAELAEWDEELLKVELKKLSGFDVRRQINCYRSGLSGREAPAHLLVDVKRRLHGGSSVWIGWSVV